MEGQISSLNNLKQRKMHYHNIARELLETYGIEDADEKINALIKEVPHVPDLRLKFASVAACILRSEGIYVTLNLVAKKFNAHLRGLHKHYALTKNRLHFRDFTDLKSYVKGVVESLVRYNGLGGELKKELLNRALKCSVLIESLLDGASQGLRYHTIAAASVYIAAYWMRGFHATDIERATGISSVSIRNILRQLREILEAEDNQEVVRIVNVAIEDGKGQT